MYTSLGLRALVPGVGSFHCSVNVTVNRWVWELVVALHTLLLYMAFLQFHNQCCGEEMLWKVLNAALSKALKKQRQNREWKKWSIYVFICGIWCVCVHSNITLHPLYSHKAEMHDYFWCHSGTLLYMYSTSDALAQDSRLYMLELYIQYHCDSAVSQVSF